MLVFLAMVDMYIINNTLNYKFLKIKAFQTS